MLLYKQQQIKIINKSLADPTFEALLLFDLCWPDSSTPGSTPAKAVSASLWVNRDTSPISAMSWGP